MTLLDRNTADVVLCGCVLVLLSAACSPLPPSGRDFKPGDVVEVSNGSNCMVDVLIGQGSIAIATIPPGGRDEFHIADEHSMIGTRVYNGETRGACDLTESRKVRLRKVSAD